MTTRFCPILSVTAQRADDCRCIGQKCAWWDLNAEQCAVLQASVKLTILENGMQNLMRYTDQGHLTLGVSVNE
jgi:hypothetical protein